jgi:hypothetical protein
VSLQGSKTEITCPASKEKKTRTEHSKQIPGTAICRDHKKQWPDFHNTDLLHNTDKFSSMENLAIHNTEEHSLKKTCLQQTL